MSITFERDKETGEVISYKNGKKSGEIITMGDVIEDRPTKEVTKDER